MKMGDNCDGLVRHIKDYFKLLSYNYSQSEILTCLIVGDKDDGMSLAVLEGMTGQSRRNIRNSIGILIRLEKVYLVRSATFRIRKYRCFPVPKLFNWLSGTVLQERCLMLRLDEYHRATSNNNNLNQWELDREVLFDFYDSFIQLSKLLSEIQFR